MGALLPSQPIPDLLTTDEVAAKLRTTSWVVCSFVRQGRLHAVKFGKEYRFTVEMVKRFIEMNRVR